MLKTIPIFFYKTYKDLFCWVTFILISIINFHPSINLFFYADDPLWINSGKMIFTTHTLSSEPFYCRIIPSIAFGIEYLFFKTDYRLYHIVNICLFIMTTIIFYALGKLIFRDRLASFTSTLCFVFSPWNFDKVNWISSQNYLWLGIFYLLTIMYFINFLKETKICYFVLFNLTFFLSIWSNESGISIIPLLILLYFWIRLQKNKFNYKHFLITFSIISLQTSLYLYKIWGLYIKGQNDAFIYRFNIIELLVFVANNLIYRIYLLPSLGSVSGWIVLIFFLCLLFFLSRAYWELKLFILWTIVSTIPFYFAPSYGYNALPDLTSNTNYLSSMGLFMIYGYSVKEIRSYYFTSGGKILKNLIIALLFLSVFFYIKYFIYFYRGVRENRYSAKYERYDSYVKEKCDNIRDGFKVYFLDGSNLKNITPKGKSISDYIGIAKTCKGGDISFDYLSFIYHLRLSYRVDNINGFCIGYDDIPNVIKPNSIVIELFNDKENE